MNNEKNHLNTLDFIQGVIDQVYENAYYNKEKSLSYNQGIQSAVLKDMEQTLYERTVEKLKE